MREVLGKTLNSYYENELCVSGGVVIGEKNIVIYVDADEFPGIEEISQLQKKCCEHRIRYEIASSMIHFFMDSNG